MLCSCIIYIVCEFAIVLYIFIWILLCSYIFCSKFAIILCISSIWFVMFLFVNIFSIRNLLWSCTKFAMFLYIFSVLNLLCFNVYVLYGICTKFAMFLYKLYIGKLLYSYGYFLVYRICYDLVRILLCSYIHFLYEITMVLYEIYYVVIIILSVWNVLYSYGYFLFEICYGPFLFYFCGINKKLCDSGTNKMWMGYK